MTKTPPPPPPNPHPRAKLLIHIQKLYLIPIIKYFAWKCIRGGMLIGENLRKNGMKVNGDSPFCVNHLEDIDHLSGQRPFVSEI